MTTRFLCCTFLISTLIYPLTSGAAVSDAAVTRDGHTLTVTWQAPEPLDVHVQQDPEGTGRVLLRRSAQGRHAFNWQKPMRPYVVLADSQGTETLVAERLLPLEGGRNFRDLGGYTTPEGQRVKWGQLFRSGTMGDLTPDDYRYLSQLGIRVVCDLRSPPERADEPTDMRAWKGPQYKAWEYEMADSGLGELLSGGATPESMRTGMLALYHEIAYEHAPRYREMFRDIATGQLPLAFNCSAGKDRAGTAAALILTALGVEREQIVHDYSLSETYVDYMAEFSGEDVDPESPYAYLAQLPTDVLAPLLRSDPDYIRATFSVLESRHGSVRAFIEDELGVSQADLTAMRRKLLE